MGLRLNNQEFGECFFVTTSFYERQQLGTHAGVYEVLAEALTFRIEKTESKLLGYVFMPSHIHLVLMINGNLLSGFMRDFKKYTSQKALKPISHSNKIWQVGYDRQAIWSQEILVTKIGYIHHNPVKAGLVSNENDWRWSSAADYIGRQESLVPVWTDWHQL